MYPSVAAALENEHRARIVRALQLFPTDRVIDRRMKSIAAPIKVKSHQTLADSIRSSKFKYAQAGFDAEHREVSFIYHSDPRRPRGIVMVRTGLTPTVRKLLKKYRKPPLRELNYQEPPRKKRATAA